MDDVQARRSIPIGRIARRLAGLFPSGQGAAILLAGLGGFIVIYLLADLAARLQAGLLIAPFGASCVLVFGLPHSPLAQPRNVIGGHLVSTAVGLAVHACLGSTPFAFGLGVGLAIVAMALTRTVHPPAGADPIVVILAGAGWSFLFVPILTGAVAIVAAGLLFRRITSRLAAAAPA